MAGKSFRSKLEPHFDFIMEMRRKHETWQAVVAASAEKGVSTQKSLVYAFIKRRLKRRYPLGVAPMPTTPPPRTHPAPTPELTENAPAEGDFAVDPLTKSHKEKRIWTKI